MLVHFWQNCFYTVQDRILFLARIYVIHKIIVYNEGENNSKFIFDKYLVSYFSLKIQLTNLQEYKRTAWKGILRIEILRWPLFRPTVIWRFKPFLECSSLFYYAVFLSCCKSADNRAGKINQKYQESIKSTSKRNRNMYVIERTNVARRLRSQKIVSRSRGWLK